MGPSPEYFQTSNVPSPTVSIPLPIAPAARAHGRTLRRSQSRARAAADRRRRGAVSFPAAPDARDLSRLGREFAQRCLVPNCSAPRFCSRAPLRSFCRLRSDRAGAFAGTGGSGWPTMDAQTAARSLCGVYSSQPRGGALHCLARDADRHTSPEVLSKMPELEVLLGVLETSRTNLLAGAIVCTSFGVSLVVSNFGFRSLRVRKFFARRRFRIEHFLALGLLGLLFFSMFPILEDSSSVRSAFSCWPSSASYQQLRFSPVRETAGGFRSYRARS